MTAIEPPPRHITMDALRGVAVMGILAMNIVAFALPEPAYVNPLAWGGTAPADLAMWAFNMVFIDGKMRGLFSLLFGASMAVVIDRAAAKGENAGAVHARRMLWLLIFGTIHCYLIWYGDILMLYAVAGLIAYFFSHQSARALIGWGIGFALVSFIAQSALGGVFFMIKAAALQPAAQWEAVETYRELAAQLGSPASHGVSESLRIHTSGYAEIVADKISPAHRFEPLTGIFLYLMETLGYMLVGMALLRNGFLAGAWPAPRYRHAALAGLALGIPPMIALCWLCFASGFDPVITFNAAVFWPAPFRLVLILAYAALILWFVTRHAGSALVGRLAATGRAAFTNYLGTSIVMTTIFYGYGLGLFGMVDRAWLYLFVIPAWALMLLWSKPWLDRFAYGPMEWLWRSLSRGALQPLRKTR
jgi:uncharacterized protein